MKYLIALLLIINPITDLDKIAKINEAKKEAERAYLAKDYAMAKTKYAYLKDSLGVNDERILLNLANAEYHLNDSTSALKTYNSLKESTNREISSLAQQQLGAMQFKSKKYKEALAHYKSALKANPANSDARYNYELLKKIIQEQEEQQQQNQDKQNKDQENKDQENKDQQDQEQQKDQEQQEKEQQEKEQQEQEKKEQEEQKQNQEQDKEQEEQKPEDQEKQKEEEQSNPNPIDEEKLKEMKISEEKAMLILEAMKNNEIQYIQQNKRKPKKKKDPTKPDW